MAVRTRFIRVAPRVSCFRDTCNVYVLNDGDAALLIDLGDGSVLEHLKEIGVRRVEWVLFTHHHREQCLESKQGTSALVHGQKGLVRKPHRINPVRAT